MGKAVKGQEKRFAPLTTFLGFAISLTGQEKIVGMAELKNRKKTDNRISSCVLSAMRLCVRLLDN